MEKEKRRGARRFQHYIKRTIRFSSPTVAGRLQARPTGLASPANQKIWCLVFRTGVESDPVNPRRRSVCLATTQTPEEFCICMIDVEQKLCVEGQGSVAGTVMENESACLTRLFLGDLFGCLHSIQRYQPKAWGSKTLLNQSAVPNSPTDHLAPSLPVLTPLEPRVARDQLLQDRMQLVLRP